MKRKFLVFILLVFMIVGCTAKQSNDMDLLTQIQEKGELVIATEGTWAPWTYHNQDDQLVGFDVELGKLIADKLGVGSSVR